MELLHKMADCLGYKFRKADIRNPAYTPRVFIETEQELKVLRHHVTTAAEIISKSMRGNYLPVHEISDLIAAAEEEVPEDEKVPANGKGNPNMTKPTPRVDIDNVTR